MRTLSWLALVLVAGCASAPQEELFGTAVVAALERERSPVVEVARFSQKRAAQPLPPHWRTYVVVPWKPRTQYALVDSEGQVCLEARSERAASGLYRQVRVRPQTHPYLEWRWRVSSLIDGADPRVAAREDSPVRVVVSFHGDPANLDEGDRAKMRLARALSGNALPYATLMYVWSNDLPVGTVVVNPHIGRVRMIVAESGPARLGQWIQLRRNTLEDYRRAFGENPWDVVAVGVMTDSDNTGTSVRAQYGDITFRSE